MEVKIEHSRYTRTYFIHLANGHVVTTRRKDDAERIARRAGATEIVHRERNVSRDLVRFGIMDKEAAATWTKEHR